MSKTIKANGSSQRAQDEKINNSFSENQLKLMKKRYLAKRPDGTQETPADMFHRIAHALAIVEKNYGRDQKFIDTVEKDFFDIISRREYTPAGRTVTNAGSSTRLIANCIVLPIMDSMESIFQTLKDAALLQQAGSGLGFSFSHLRPAMFPTKKSSGVSSGPVSFLNVYNEAFSILQRSVQHHQTTRTSWCKHGDDEC
jgi:ribonucleoside-diphosphate reductase alpha chain